MTVYCYSTLYLYLIFNTVLLSQILDVYYDSILENSILAENHTPYLGNVNYNYD